MFIHNGLAQGGRYSRGMAKDILVRWGHPFAHVELTVS